MNAGVVTSEAAGAIRIFRVIEAKLSHVGINLAVQLAEPAPGGATQAA